MLYQRAAAEIGERLSGETLRVEAGRYDRYCPHSTRKHCGDSVAHSQSYLRRIFGVNHDFVLNIATIGNVFPSGAIVVGCCEPRQ
jgi:hypothetical protein